MNGLAKCRVCAVEYAAPAWNFRASDFQCTPCRREYLAGWRERRKAEGRPVRTGSSSPEVIARYFSRPDQRRRLAVRAKTRRAVATGLIQREPCMRCGAEAEAHHDDYTRPLDVTWLCRSHHAARHRELRATGASS